MAEPFVCVPSRVMRNMALSPTAFRLYCLLIDYNSTERGCFPKQETLQRDLCAKTVRTVQRALAELVSAQLIEVERRYDGLHNRYKLSVQATFLSPVPDKNVVSDLGDTTKMSCDQATKMSPPIKEQEPTEQENVTTTNVVVAEQVPPTPKKPTPIRPPKKRTANDDQPDFQFVEAFSEFAGYRPANFGEARKCAKRLLGAGCTVADIPALYTYCKSWADGVDLRLMASQYDRFCDARIRPQPTKPVRKDLAFG